MRVRSIILALSLSCLGVAPAFAITFGEPDGNDHPTVAAIIVNYDEVPYPGWTGYNEWCTATLIHPRVLVTAAHCTYDLEAAGYPDAVHDIWVSFHPDPVSRPKTWRRVSAIVTHPEYDQNPSGEWTGVADPHDIALLVLDKPVSTKPSTLAPLGFLEALQDELGVGNDTAQLLAVGFGGQLTYPPPEIVYLDTRWRAWMSYMGLHDAWLLTSQNPRLGDGGTCYGDSGGPVFWVDEQGKETLVAITSWGDVPCVSFGFYYRLDSDVSVSLIADVIADVEAGAL